MECLSSRREREAPGGRARENRSVQQALSARSGAGLAAAWARGFQAGAARVAGGVLEGLRYAGASGNEGRAQRRRQGDERRAAGTCDRGYRGPDPPARCWPERQGDRGGNGSRPELAGARKRRHQDAQGLKSASPKVLEPVGRKLGVADRVLDVLVPEVVLQSPCVVAVVGKLEPTGMAKHVRVDRKGHLGGLPEALDKPVETDGADWPAALGNEYVGVCRVIAA